MTILFLLIPLALLLLAAAVAVFFWAASDGQFDDLDTPAMSIFESDSVEQRH